MKTQRRLALALGLAAILALGCFVAAGKSPADAEGSKAEEKAEEKEQPAKGKRAATSRHSTSGGPEAMAEIRLWDAASGTQLRCLQGHEYRRSSARARAFVA
jgi:hypothetical protein